MSAAEWVYLCGASVSRALHFLVGASGFLGFFKLALWLIVRLWCRSSSDAAAGEFSVCFRGSSPVRKFLSLIRCLGLGRASWGAYACCARSKVSRYTMLTSPVSQDRPVDSHLQRGGAISLAPLSLARRLKGIRGW